MNIWTEERRNQFKNLLKTIPSEDVALMTASVWCREFNLKRHHLVDFIYMSRQIEEIGCQLSKCQQWHLAFGHV